MHLDFQYRFHLGKKRFCRALTEHVKVNSLREASQVEATSAAASSALNKRLCLQHGTSYSRVNVKIADAGSHVLLSKTLS